VSITLCQSVKILLGPRFLKIDGRQSTSSLASTTSSLSRMVRPPALLSFLFAHGIF
jgi:hypothetical protein